MRNYGIDYGTTRSLTYEYKDGKNTQISDQLSAVVVRNREIVCSGKEAWDYNGDGSFVKSPKRCMANCNESPNTITINGVSFSEMILETLKKMLSNIVFDKNDFFTITIPNTFSANQYTWMTQWLNQLVTSKTSVNTHKNSQVAILPEPIAAALYFVHTSWRKIDKEKINIVVCDIGGGTTDMCIVQCQRKTTNGLRDLVFSVVGKHFGDPNLGGDDFDNNFAAKLGFGKLWKEDKEKRNRIIAWKSLLSVETEIPAEYDNRPITITRSTFENCINNDLNRIKTMLTNLRDCVKDNDAQWVILPVGGSCKIPAIQKLLSDVFRCKKALNASSDDITIFESVAQGAAIYSAFRNNDLKGYNSISISNCISVDISYAWGTSNREVVVPANTPDGISDSHFIRLKDNNCNDKDYFRIGLFDVYVGNHKINTHFDNLFPLNGRKLDDVRLQLIFNIQNQKLTNFEIKDNDTGMCVAWNENK